MFLKKMSSNNMMIDNDDHRLKLNIPTTKVIPTRVAIK